MARGERRAARRTLARIRTSVMATGHEATRITEKSLSMFTLNAKLRNRTLGETRSVGGFYRPTLVCRTLRTKIG